MTQLIIDGMRMAARFVWEDDIEIESSSGKALSLRHPFAHELRLQLEQELSQAVEDVLAKVFNNLERRIREEVTYEEQFAQKGLKQVQDIMTDEAFWEAQAQLVVRGLTPVAHRILRAGAEEGSLLVGQGVFFDRLNPQMLAYTRQFTHHLWDQLEHTRRESLRQALIDWQQGGLGRRGMPDLLQALEPVYGRTAAELIGTTEATRLFAQGSLVAWGEMDGISGVQWATAEDELVCSLCRGLNGQEWPKGQPGEVPPRHPRCRCSLLPVESNGEVVMPQESAQQPWEAAMDPDLVESTDESLVEALFRAGVEQYDYSLDDFAPVVKNQVVEELAARLKDNPAFVEMAESMAKATLSSVRYEEPVRDAVDTIIQKWAATAADSDSLALAMQRAVRDEFGLVEIFDPTTIEYGTAMERVVEANYRTYGAGMRAFVRAEYESTQAWLKANKITSVRLHRGVSWKGENQAPPEFRTPGVKHADVRLLPASSFSLSRGTASSFVTSEGFGAELETVVPTGRILSTARTGRGCLNEWEVLVLGGSGARVRAQVRVRIRSEL